MALLLADRASISLTTVIVAQGRPACQEELTVFLCLGHSLQIGEKLVLQRRIRLGEADVNDNAAVEIAVGILYLSDVFPDSLLLRKRGQCGQC